MKKDYKHILFDFDGTLMDTSEGIFNSFDYALEKLGMQKREHSFYHKLVGPPLLDTFKNVFGMTEEGAQGALELYREYYSPKGLYQVKLFEGIEELLHGLKTANKKLYVATSKPEVYAKELLASYNLLHLFTFVGGSNMAETRVKKCEVINYVIENANIQEEKSLCLMVGDRKYDVAGAKEAGIDCVGAEWGFGSKEELLSEGAIGTVKSCKDLLNQILHPQL